MITIIHFATTFTTNIISKQAKPVKPVLIRTNQTDIDPSRKLDFPIRQFTKTGFPSLERV